MLVKLLAWGIAAFGLTVSAYGMTKLIEQVLTVKTFIFLMREEIRAKKADIPEPEVEKWVWTIASGLIITLGAVIVLM